jgi:hypothetical protein
MLMCRKCAGTPRQVSCLDLVIVRRERYCLLALRLVIFKPALSSDCAWAPVLGMSATVQKNNRDTFGRGRTSTVITIHTNFSQRLPHTHGQQRHVWAAHVNRHNRFQRPPPLLPVRLRSAALNFSGRIRLRADCACADATRLLILLLLLS